jgi:gliding motility-associated-like protein
MKKNFFLFCTLLLFFNAGFLARAQQVVMNGNATIAVPVPAGGCTYNWVNSNPAIGLPAKGTGNIPSFTAVNTTGGLAYATVTAIPVTAPLAYIPNTQPNSVQVLNTGTDKVDYTIPLSASPSKVTISPDGTRAYVLAGIKLYTINTASQTVIDSVRVGINPQDIVVSPDGKRVYVSNGGNAPGITLYNTTTRAVGHVYFTHKIDNLYFFTTHITVSPDGNRVYVANAIDSLVVPPPNIPHPGYVAVINTYDNFIVSNIDMPLYLGAGPGPLLLSPDGTKLYVSRANILIVDTKTNMVTDSLNYGCSAFALNASGSKLYLVSYNNYTVVNTTTKQPLVNTLINASNPTAISFPPDSSKIYVVNAIHKNITEVNPTYNTSTSITLGGALGTSSPNFIATPPANCSPITVNYIITPTPSVPTIVATGTPAVLTTTLGKASASSSFSVSSFKLTAGITISPPPGFEVSTDNINFSPTLTVGTGGDTPATLVYIRLTASTAVGSYAGNIKLSSSPAPDQVVAVSGSVSPVGSTVPNQTVYNGQATQAVVLPGIDCVDGWASDIPIGLPATGIGDIKLPSFTAVNTGTKPVTATISILGPSNGVALYVINQLSGQVWSYGVPVTNPVTGSAVPISSEGYGIVVNHANTRVFVTNKTPGTVTVIKAGSAIANIPVGKAPEGIAISLDDSTVYVANSADGTISLIDTKTSNLKGSPITLGALGAAGLAISPDGSSLYVANSGSGSVSVVSTATNTVIGNYLVGASPQNIVVSPDGKKLYVTNTGSNSVSVVNTVNGSVVTIIAGTNPWGIAISRDGSRVYVTNQASNNVTVINTSDNSVVATVGVGKFPGGVSVTPDGNQVYVTNFLSNDVSVISTASNTVTNTFPADNLGGNGPFNDIVSGPSGCSTPFTFTITVLPTPPSIAATGYLSALTTSSGVASSPTSFNVSGISLTAGVLVSPPTGFEVSTDNINFGPTVTVGGAGNLTPTPVYVRLAASDPPGTYSGDIVLSSPGATNVTVPTAPSTVTQAVPAIVASAASGKVRGCAGSPSTTPGIQQFTVSAVALNGVLTASATSDFEVSLDPNTGYARTVDISSLSKVSNLVVYVRSSATALGIIRGNVTITSPGAGTKQVAVYGVAYPVPTANPVTSQTLADGQTTTAINFTGTNTNSFTWTNDKPGIGIGASGKGNIASFTAVNPTSSPVIANITATPISTILAYVANKGDGTISVIDVQSNTLVAIIPVDSSPQIMLISDDGSTLYVALPAISEVAVISTGTNKVLANIKLGYTSVAGMAFSADGSELNVLSFDGAVRIVSLATYAVIATVDLPLPPAYPPGTIISPDGSRVYSWDGNTGFFYIYNAITNAYLGNTGIGSTSQGLVLSPDGHTIYTTNVKGNNVTVIDAATNNIIITIGVGGSPQGLNLSPDGSTLYVTNGADNTVSVINTGTNAVIKTLNVGHFPAAVVTTGGTGCSGIPAKFTITVNPPKPTINASGTLNVLTTPYGTASDATSFIVSGTNLTEAILLTPPAGFELSLDSLNFSPTLSIGTGGNVPPTKIYVRLAAGTPVGSYSGDIVLSSLGADDVHEPTAANCTVTAPLQTIIVGTVTGSIAACSGNASASPFIQQFKVTGKLLTGNLIVTSQVNFEVSLDPATGFGSSISIAPTNGTVGPVTVYVRSAAYAAGSITGSITLSSAGAVPQYATVRGNITFTPKVNAVNNQVVANGAFTGAINFTGTGNTYNWTNDTPGIGLAASGGGNIPAFAAINNGSTPITANITVTPVSASLAYIPSSASNSVTVVNTQTNQVVNTIPVGATPYATIVGKDGSYVYVASHTSNTISVINAVTGKVSTIPVGNNPASMALSPDGSTLYVSNNGSNNVSVISTATNSTITTINVGISPEDITISPDGSKLYVVCRNSTNVYVVDVASYRVLATIMVGASPQGLVLSPDGSTLYVANYNGKSVSVINTVTNAVTATIAGLNGPQGLAISGDGKTLYVTNAGANTVAVINTGTNLITASIKVGSGPDGITISPDGTQVYVANYLSSSVSVINTATNTVTNTITVGPYPVSLGSFISTGLGCPGNPYTFTITVKPLSNIGITATGTLAALTTVYGTPSGAESFTVTGNNLTAGMLVSAPNGFEVSTDNQNFGKTLTVQRSATLAPVLLYVRLAATTPVGTYSGNIALSSAGIADVQVTIPNSTVTTIPLTITADNKTKKTGAANPVLTVSYSGFVNSDGPAQLTAQALLSTTAVTNSPAGQYPITVGGAASNNYTFVYVPGILTVNATDQVLVIPNAFTPNGDGINDTWVIKNLNSYAQCTVTVFNRFGQQLFFSNNYPVPWDGRYKGANLPTGTYYYIINVGNAGKPIAGEVVIIR